MKKNNKKTLKSRNKKLAKIKKQQKDKKKQVNKLNSLKNSKMEHNSNEIWEMMKSELNDDSYNNEVADEFKEKYGKISENIIDFSYMIFGERNNIEKNLSLAMDIWNYSIYRDAEIYGEEYYKLKNSLLLEFNENDLDEFYYNKSSLYKGDIRLVKAYNYNQKNEYLQVLSYIDREVNDEIFRVTSAMAYSLKKYSEIIRSNKILKKSDLDNLGIIVNKNRNNYDIVMLYGDALQMTETKKNLETSIIIFKHAATLKEDDIEPYLSLLETYINLGRSLNVIGMYQFLENFIIENNSKNNLLEFKKFKKHYKKSIEPKFKKGFEKLGENYDKILKYVKGYELFKQAIFNDDFSENTILLLENLLPLISWKQKEYLFLAFLSLIVGNMDKFEFYKKKIDKKALDFNFTFDSNTDKEEIKEALITIIWDLEYL